MRKIQTMPMRTLNRREDALHLAALRNGGKALDYVVVEGPNDNEWTVMHITDAIENDFLYEWSLPY